MELTVVNWVVVVSLIVGNGLPMIVTTAAAIPPVPLAAAITPPVEDALEPKKTLSITQKSNFWLIIYRLFRKFETFGTQFLVYVPLKETY